jgi:mRNA-degrading endonuclease RelE of RelBE toxin-antitoxin system
MRVEISEQAFRFVLSQSPEPRRRLRSALRGLEHERGDIRALEGRLSGYHRLRVGAYRVIFRYTIEKNKRAILCEFIEKRSIVYQVFESLALQLRPPK